MLTSLGHVAKRCTQNPGAVSIVPAKEGLRGQCPFLGKGVHTDKAKRQEANHLAGGSVDNAGQEDVTCLQCSDNVIASLLTIQSTYVHCRKMRGCTRNVTQPDKQCCKDFWIKKPPSFPRNVPYTSVFLKLVSYYV